MDAVRADVTHHVASLDRSRNATTVGAPLAPSNSDTTTWPPLVERTDNTFATAKCKKFRAKERAVADDVCNPATGDEGHSVPLGALGVPATATEVEATTTRAMTLTVRRTEEEIRFMRRR